MKKRAVPGVYGRRIARFVDSLPTHLSYGEMERACVERFGARAWSRSKIVRYWHRAHPVGKGRASLIEGNPDIREFIDGRLPHFGLGNLVAACRAEFGERAPSKSSIHRYWVKLRGSSKPKRRRPGKSHQ